MKGKAFDKSNERYLCQVWNYADIDNLDAERMFPGSLTRDILITEPEKILPYLFRDFDDSFAGRVNEKDIIITGGNFGCGSSTEHAAVGLAYAGVKAIICKSVDKTFYRFTINQGLPVIIHPEAVDAYKKGDEVAIDFQARKIYIDDLIFPFEPLPDELMRALKAKGLVNFMKQMN